MRGIISFTGYGSRYAALPLVNRLYGSLDNWIYLLRFTDWFLSFSNVRLNFQDFSKFWMLADH